MMRKNKLFILILIILVISGLIFFYKIIENQATSQTQAISLEEAKALLKECNVSSIHKKTGNDHVLILKDTSRREIKGELDQEFNTVVDEASKQCNYKILFTIQ